MNAIGMLSTHMAANEQRFATALISMAEILQPAASTIRVSVPTTSSALHV